MDDNTTSKTPLPAVGQSFAVGDLVQLRSGGGRLTVTGSDNGAVQAICVSDDGRVDRVWLPAVCFVPSTEQ